MQNWLLNVTVTDKAKAGGKELEMLASVAASENRLSDFIHVSWKHLLPSFLMLKKCPPSEKLYPGFHLSLKRSADLLLLHFHPNLTFIWNLSCCFASSFEQSHDYKPFLSGGKGVGGYKFDNFSVEGHIHLVTKNIKGGLGDFTFMLIAIPPA